MADYFDEMGFTPLADGETPNNALHIARFLRDFGIFPSEFENSNDLPPPTSKSVIENLPEYKIETQDVQCTVCLKKFNINEMVKELPCSHKFHSPCILPWLEKTSTCPLCRHDLVTDNEEYEEYKKSKIREKQREQDIEMLHNSMFS